MATAHPIPFDVTATDRDGLAMVAVTGELDCDTAPRLHQVLADLAGPGRVILVDLSQTEFMDCAGISPLVAACRRQRELGGNLVLDSPGGAISKVIERTQLDKLMTVVGNALSLLPGPAAALYHCGRCEVYGWGAKCWCCANTRLDWGHVPQLEDLPRGNRPAAVREIASAPGVFAHGRQGPARAIALSVAPVA